MVFRSFCSFISRSHCLDAVKIHMSKQGKKQRLSPNASPRDIGCSGVERWNSSLSGNGQPRRKVPFRTVNDLSPSTSSASFKLDNVISRTEDIDKSPNDLKKYRHIKLRNGLRALLISDPSEVGSSITVTESDNSKEKEVAGLSELSFGSSESESEEDAEDDKSTVKLSAAGLCIGAGSFCDPAEAPGLAHFLEHMVFMGSDKYPEENAYDSFIKKHGGDDNASTDCERTLFYFDIQQEHFRQALDMFAQFFIHPLLKKSSIYRERQAVDSEFEQSLTSDYVRKQQLKALMAHKDHPMGNFMWGNMESLKEGSELHERLQTFHREMYSAQYMTLAVQAEESLDTLEKWVSETFSDIPNNGKPPKTFKHRGEVFDKSRFCKLYKVIPVKSINQIEITWSLPSQLDNFRTKPLGYLSFLIGHEGEGSILSFLKKKCWALGLYAGTGEYGFEHNTATAMFSVTISLTDEGLANYYEVLTCIFQYVAMLKREGPQKQIFDEIKRVDEIDFIWQEECDPTDNVEDLCAEMQLYPPKLYLCGSHLLLNYEPWTITECLEEMTPRNANIMILSKSFEDKDICNKTEKWYKTKYSVSDINPYWLKSWNNPENNPNLHLPGRNEFIATDFQLLKLNPDVQMTKKPALILDNDQGRLWYKPNNKFSVPKAYIFFHLITPLANQTPQTMVLFDLFLRLLKQNLTELAYPADLAQLWYELKDLETGMSIRVGGFNHKLARLFELIVDHMVEFSVSQEMFDAVKDKASRDYYNHFIKPAKLVTDLRVSIIQQTHWSAVDKRSFVNQITRDMLMSFVEEFKTKLFIEGLVIGNMTSEEALRIEKYLCSKLQCAVLPRNARPEIRCVQLPRGKFYYCRVENFNKEDVNSSVTHYYQLEPTSIKASCICDLISSCMEEPCFDILRTREQLGYSVWCASHLTNGILGFSLNVETQSSKFSLNEVDEKMISFVQEYGRTLNSMTQKEFKAQVTALVGLKKKEETNLLEEADKYWNEIITQNYVFDRMEKEIEAVSKISKSELYTWYKANLLNPERYKKLSIQVQGCTTKTDAGSTSELQPCARPPLRRHSSSCNGIKISDHMVAMNQQRQQDIDWGGMCELVYLPVGKVPMKYCIMDIPGFKRLLPVYPVHKANTW
ncbi:nardilysin-like [Liolophura sinensis]|uniref:nardilysin-like n=1 Tax=Liolophura sinensis TaxID=3198878 RepID=UPI003158D572